MPLNNTWLTLGFIGILSGFYSSFDWMENNNSLNSNRAIQRFIANKARVVALGESVYDEIEWNSCFIKQTRGLVSKETVVLRRWGRETQKFWVYLGVRT